MIKGPFTKSKKQPLHYKFSLNQIHLPEIQQKDNFPIFHRVKYPENAPEKLKDYCKSKLIPHTRAQTQMGMIQTTCKKRSVKNKENLTQASSSKKHNRRSINVYLFDEKLGAQRSVKKYNTKIDQLGPGQMAIKQFQSNPKISIQSVWQTNLMIPL